MASNNPDCELDDAGDSEPLLVSEVDTDADADAVVDAEELRARIATSKAARRWTRIRITVGIVTALITLAIFVRLSRYRRPFDCKLDCSPALQTRRSRWVGHVEKQLSLSV
jgi:hypothetical protein